MERDTVGILVERCSELRTRAEAAEAKLASTEGERDVARADAEYGHKRARETEAKLAEAEARLRAAQPLPESVSLIVRSAESDRLRVEQLWRQALEDLAAAEAKLAETLREWADERLAWDRVVMNERARIKELEAKLAEANETIECYKAMKSGVAVRISDLEAKLAAAESREKALRDTWRKRG